MSMLNRLMAILMTAGNKEVFFKRIAEFYPSLDPRYQEILRAYEIAKEAFRNDIRDDGVQYFEHLRAVGLITLYQRITDYEIIIAAILHDLVEDHPREWSIERIRRELGERVALLVQYCSKPPLEECGGSKEEQDRIYHRRFAQAPREFFLIKLADMLHNVLTLNGCELEKRQRKIAETWQYYMPYAEKHGILYYELLDALEMVKLS